MNTNFDKHLRENIFYITNLQFITKKNTVWKKCMTLRQQGWTSTISLASHSMVLKLILWQADDTIGIIYSMMQSVSSIQKFAKNWGILWLYSCFVTYIHKKLWDLIPMHRLWVVPTWVQSQATDSAMLTAIMCGVMRVVVLSLWCLAFSLQDFC